MQRRRPKASCRLQPAAELSDGFIVIPASLKPWLQIAVISKVTFFSLLLVRHRVVPAALHVAGFKQQ